jgi:CelD/BcsL family acetyltransferase involved in cellulose biosynthesis
MQIEIITDHAGFEALREPWTQLQDRVAETSVFMTWEWQYIWWKHYGDGQELRLIVVRHAGIVTGILPLYLQNRRVMRLVPVKILRNVGTGGDTAPDYLDPLIDPTHAQEIADGLAQKILDGTLAYDQLTLADFNPASAFAQALRKRIGPKDAARCESVSARISFANLPDSWTAYLETLSSDRRNVVRRFRRKLEALPAARFFTWQDAATLDTGIDRLIELHLKRWTDRSDSHAFSSKAYVGFHREVMHACLEKGWLRLFCIEAEGQIMAMLYCYRYRDRMYYFQGGFDPDMSKLRPGLVLMGHAIEQAILEGARVYDMLRGEYEFKTQWAKERHDTAQFSLSRNTPAGLTWHLRTQVLPALKKRFASGAENRPIEATTAAAE